MTLLEKAKEIIKAEGKNVSENGIIEYSCPSDYELEEAKNCVSEGRKGCEECWNREMPNTEAKGIKVIPQAEVDAWNNAHESGKAEGYEQGLNDAWEFCKRIYKILECDVYKPISICDLSNIYGTATMLEILNLTPQEAIAKLKAYEEEQNKIEIGDVITYAGEKGLVLVSPYNKFVVLTHDGWIQEWYECDVKKTGKHIDIQSILEQIGE